VNTNRTIRMSAAVALALALAASASAQAFQQRPIGEYQPGQERPDVLRDVGIEQRLNEKLPFEAEFRDESGKPVKLGDYFQNGKPTILALVYYECPMLCNMVLNGLTSSLSIMKKLSAGKDFNVVTVSFDPRETPELAAAKRAGYLHRYNRPGAEQGWHFLTGDQENIDLLTKAVGFRYAWDARQQQFAHASAIMIVTPDGRLARYHFGIEYDPPTLRLGLVEASQNKIGSAVDQVLLFCFHYDPQAGRYGPAIMNILRALGVATVGLMGGFILWSVRRDRRKAMHQEQAG
jgi:protein SCO1/2